MQLNKREFKKLICNVILIGN